MQIKGNNARASFQLNGITIQLSVLCERVQYLIMERGRVISLLLDISDSTLESCRFG